MLHHIQTSRAGDSAYYSDHVRGTVDVLHDSKRYVYRKPWEDVRKFKRELLAAFGERCEARISGKYPCYEITTFC